MRGQGVSHKQGSAFFCLTAIGSHLTASVMPTIKHIKILYYYWAYQMLQAKGKLNLPALGSQVKHSKQQRLTPIISLLQNYRIFHRGNWSYTHGALSGRHQSMLVNNPRRHVMVINIIITRPTLAYSLQGLGLALGARKQSGRYILGCSQCLALRLQRSAWIGYYCLNEGIV